MMLREMCNYLTLACTVVAMCSVCFYIKSIITSKHIVYLLCTLYDSQINSDYFLKEN